MKAAGLDSRAAIQPVSTKVHVYEGFGTDDAQRRDLQGRTKLPAQLQLLEIAEQNNGLGVRNKASRKLVLIDRGVWSETKIRRQ
jgi:hypothetical protein